MATMMRKGMVVFLLVSCLLFMCASLTFSSTMVSAAHEDKPVIHASIKKGGSSHGGGSGSHGAGGSRGSGGSSGSSEKGSGSGVSGYHYGGGGHYGSHQEALTVPFAAAITAALGTTFLLIPRLHT